MDDWQPKARLLSGGPTNRRSERFRPIIHFGVSYNAMPTKQHLTKRRIALIQLEQSLNLLDAGDP